MSIVNTYTDEQLKQALAKMLPEKLHIVERVEFEKFTPVGCQIKRTKLKWISNVSLNIAIDTNISLNEVLNTELLHLCWLVEESFDADNWNDYCAYLATQVHAMYETEHLAHATWQQCTIALAKVKGVEIV